MWKGLGRRASDAGLRRVFHSELPPRVLLIFPALFIQAAGQVLSSFAVKTGSTALVTASVFVWLLWFALVFSMARPSIDKLLRQHRKGMLVVAFALALLLSAMAIGEATALVLVNTGTIDNNEMGESLTRALSYNDSTALSHQASQRLLDGSNPYVSSDIVEAVREFELPVTFLTPLQQGAFADTFPYPSEEQMDEALRNALASPDESAGEFESKLSYPAGSFLLQAPFVALGLEDMRVFYLLCAIALAAAIIWLAPRPLRPLAVTVCLTNLVLWNLVATGTTDTLYLLFVFLGWVFRRKLWISALLMGIAAATKQTAWVFLVFYLILLVREAGWREAAKSLGVVGATFAALNVPFILDAPQAWLEGVFAPVLDPMFPRGSGIVVLSITGFLPPSSLPFTALEAVVLVVAAVWYYFNCRRYPQAGLVLAVLPFFFAWRSFSCYFCLASLLVFGAVLIEIYWKRGRGPARMTLSEAG